MKGWDTMIWANAWGAYHQKNYGAAKALLEKIQLDNDDEEMKEQYDMFMEMLNEELERR